MADVEEMMDDGVVLEVDGGLLDNYLSVDATSTLSRFAGCQKAMVYWIIMAVGLYIWGADKEVIFNSATLLYANVMDKIKIDSFEWLKFRAKVAYLT
ncbi:hypothetical protein QVD17_11724 [Tagetes erecta]|uniref:Uncharacterized protein n=1 Tax=Tagetes erecta TaxID=13708 RepID=A0AAD8KTZ9_TARER|nr:hypothetical protein QVD17_11724 [Tagetes erecta]